MKIAGILEAGIESGILTKAKYIQGGYIVAANQTEVASIPTSVLVIGTPLYVSAENKSYRWDGSKWVEEQILLDAPSDTKLYLRKNGAWFELIIDSTPTLDSDHLVTSNGIKKAIDAEKERAQTEEDKCFKSVNIDITVPENPVDTKVLSEKAAKIYIDKQTTVVNVDTKENTLKFIIGGK